MDAAIILGLYLAVILICSLPTLMLCLIARKLLPARLKTNTKAIYPSAIFLSIVTIIILSPKLEGGIPSAAATILTLSSAWALTLILISTAYKISISRKTPQQGT